MPGCNSRNQVLAEYLVLWKSCQNFSSEFFKNIWGLISNKIFGYFFFLCARPFCFLITPFTTPLSSALYHLVRTDYRISYQLSAFLIQCIGPFRVARRRKRSPSPFFLTGNQVVTKISFFESGNRDFSSSWCPLTTMIQGVGGDLFRCSIFGGEGGENWKKSVTFVFVLWCYAHILPKVLLHNIKKINFWPRIALFDQQQ